MPRLGFALSRLLFRISKLKRIEWYICYTTLNVTRVDGHARYSRIEKKDVAMWRRPMACESLAQRPYRGERPVVAADSQTIEFHAGRKLHHPALVFRPGRRIGQPECRVRAMRQGYRIGGNHLTLLIPQSPGDARILRQTGV